MTNALLAPWTTAFALPPFDLIRDEDFAPAFEAGLAEARAAIAAIADNPAPATFANTIDALELAEATLDRVAGVFFNIAGSDSTPAREALALRQGVCQDFAHVMVGCLRSRSLRRVRLRSRRRGGGAWCASAAATRASGTGRWWGGTTYTVLTLAVLLALFAHELYAPCREERAGGRRIAHLDEARVEVDLGGERGDGDERGRADAEDRRDGLVEEALVAVRGLFEDEHVAAGALRRPDLHTHRAQY
jgi:hypothetical protein